MSNLCLDSEESSDDGYSVCHQDKPTVGNPRMTVTLQAGKSLIAEFTNEHEDDSLEEEMDLELDGDYVTNSPKVLSPTSQLKAMNPEQIQELLRKTETLQMTEGKSSNSEDESVGKEESDMINHSDKEGSTRRGTKKNNKDVTKQTKGRKVIESTNKEEAVSEEVNQNPDEQEIVYEKGTKPKKGTKNQVVIEKGSAKSTLRTKVAKSKTTTEKTEKEDKKNNKGKKVEQKYEQVQDLMMKVEEDDENSKPVNTQPKGRGKPKPKNELNDNEKSKPQDGKAKKNPTKAPIKKTEPKEMKITENTTHLEKENKPLVETRSARLKGANKNKENDTEEISVSRKRVNKTNKMELVEPGQVPDQSNVEEANIKVGKEKVTKSRAKKALQVQPIVTEEVLPKRSTRNKKM